MSLSHHNSFEEQEAERRLLDQFLGRAKQNHPEGRLNRDDQGELSFAIAADEQNQTVVVQFGKPVAWFGMPKKETVKFAQMLLDKASQLK